MGLYEYCFLLSRIVLSCVRSHAFVLGPLIVIPLLFLYCRLKSGSLVRRPFQTTLPDRQAFFDICRCVVVVSIIQGSWEQIWFTPLSTVK